MLNIFLRVRILQYFALVKLMRKTKCRKDFFSVGLLRKIKG